MSDVPWLAKSGEEFGIGDWVEVAGVLCKVAGVSDTGVPKLRYPGESKPRATRVGEVDRRVRLRDEAVGS